MEINNFKDNNLSQNMDDKIYLANISHFLKELSERIEKMQDVLIIDRFEGEYAVCEKSKTKEMIDIKIEDLPEGSKEGTVLKLKNGKYEIDLEEQKKIEDRIKKKMDSLWNN